MADPCSFSSFLDDLWLSPSAERLICGPRQDPRFRLLYIVAFLAVCSVLFLTFLLVDIRSPASS